MRLNEETAAALTGFAEAAIDNGTPHKLQTKITQALDAAYQSGFQDGVGDVQSVANNYALDGKERPQIIEARHYQAAITYLIEKRDV